MCKGYISYQQQLFLHLHSKPKEEEEESSKKWPYPTRSHIEKPQKLQVDAIISINLFH